ncbi:interleukin-15-like isoform X2 [Macrotis lagotis]|uniref:interleukin-15-like isoform X2 n=1 Tax=Macrotis lagotis TaxID=92651 RepID=UPI003D69819E
MWLFWAFLVFIHPLGGPPLQSPSCPWEPFEGLVAIMEALGDTNDGTLYTPDNLSVCPMEILRCFGVELSVIGHEEGPPLARAVNRLQRTLRALGPHLWGIRGRAASEPCPPCEGYPERPVLQFLVKLLELLQVACAGVHQVG